MKTNKKSMVLISLILVFVLLALTACGGGGDTTKTPAADTPQSGDATAAVNPADLTFDDAPIQWKMQSIWAESITLWRGDKYFVDLVNRLALGELYIEYNPGGSMVTTSDELFDAISTGAIDMGTDWPSYWEGRNTAFTLITSTPCVLTPADYIMWFWQAGGIQLCQEMYAKYNIMWYPHSITSPESGQRTNKAITEIKDYAGLKLRQCGRTQALVLEQLGAGAVFLPGADIYLSVDRGVVDGAEFGVPETDWSMAFQEITKYHIGPGWHQPGPASGVMFNMDKYNELTDHTKYILKESAMASMLWAWSFFEYSSARYQNKFEEAGIITSRLSDDAISQIQKISWDILIKDATENPDHCRLAFSQVKMLYDYAEWRDIQEPFSFGRNPEGLDETYAALEKLAKDHGVYDAVIAAADANTAASEAQEHWEPGTPYAGSPIAQ